MSYDPSEASSSNSMPRGRGGSARRGGGGSVQASSSLTFLLMENALDKLKLLNYEKDFAKPRNLEPLHRFSFAQPQENTHEQFLYFTRLIAWLLMEFNSHFIPEPSHSDDPNSVVANILMELKKKNVDTSFPPTQLKAGWGDAVCTLLNMVLDMTLTNTGFTYQEPVPVVDEEEEFEDVGGDDSLLDMSGALDIEEEGSGFPMGGLDDDDELDDEDDDFLAMEYGKGKGKAGEGASSSSSSSSSSSAGVGGSGGRPANEQILEPSRSTKDWKLEYERVRPNLKLQIRRDNKDWRSHHAQLKEHEHAVGKSLEETKTRLDKFRQRIQADIDSIRSSERMVNDNCKEMGGEYREAKEKLDQRKEEYRRTRAKVDDLTNELESLAGLLAEVKEQTEQKESNMTDQSPVVRIKKSLSNIKKEVRDMEVRIGVLEHTLNAARLKKRSQLESSIREPEGDTEAIRTFLNGAGSSGQRGGGPQDDEDEYEAFGVF